MELQHLRDFVVLSEELHFGRAAERLHIAQPALSQHVGRLERLWGGQLFDRTGHRLTLTPLGELMLVQARRILDDCDHASEIARRAAVGDIGVLRIGLATAVDPTWFNSALKTLHTRYPDLCFTVLEMSSPEICQSLRARRLDIGIAWLPADTAGLRSTVLLREEHVAVLPLDHPLGQRASIPMRELDDQPLISFPRSMSADIYDFLNGLFRAAGAVPRVQHESFTVENNLMMTQAGLGISLIPRRYLEATHPEGVTTRPICDPTPVLEVSMLVRADEHRRATDVFRTLLRAGAAGVPGVAPAVSGASARRVDGGLHVNDRRAVDWLESVDLNP